MSAKSVNRKSAEEGASGEALPTWMAPDGAPVSCIEKLKLLNENLEEIHDLCREALEDAVLMGCDEDQVRSVLRDLVDSLDKPFSE